MISAIELEKCVVNTSIFGIIISKLRYGKKPCLIILFKDNKSSKVSFHCTILPLSLAVRLRVEGGRKSPFDAEEIE